MELLLEHEHNTWQMLEISRQIRLPKIPLPFMHVHVTHRLLYTKILEII